jgi:hypothetical protein
MTNSQQRPINLFRVLAASALLLLVAAFTVVVVRSLPQNPLGWLVALALGLAVLPMLASPIEWLVHRYVYHRHLTPVLRPIYEIHHQGHHHIFFPTWRYVTGGPPRRLPIRGSDRARVHTTDVGNGLVRLAHWLFYMSFGLVVVWPALWFATHSLPFLIGAVIASTIVSDLFISVHDAIHRPGSHPLLERQRWFQFLDAHHYVHHVDTEVNVNFLLPLSDWLFGTLRRSLTPEELARHGTREAAKAQPEGEGEPASRSPARARRRVAAHAL